MRKRAAATDNEQDDHVGILVRQVPVRVVDISRSGCLLECPDSFLETGMGGELRIQIGRTTYSDDIRVARRVLVEGSATLCRAGVELQVARPLGERSLRTAIRRAVASGQPAGEHAPASRGKHRVKRTKLETVNGGRRAESSRAPPANRK